VSALGWQTLSEEAGEPFDTGLTKADASKRIDGYSRKPAEVWNRRKTLKGGALPDLFASTDSSPLPVDAVVCQEAGRS
jgi:hypothetical protein